MTRTGTGTVEAQTGPTDRFVDWIVGTGADDLPDDTRAFARALLLKVVTSLVVGAGEPFGELVIDHARRAGGTPEAGVAGGGFRTSLEAAAHANGTIAHTPEMEDCFFRPENRETSSPVWMFPALLSAGEALGSSGRDVVTAAVVSFDVASRLVRGAPGLGVRHGINTCTWWGVPATAAGVARLLGLDRTATAHAVSIALSQSCGLGHQTGYDAHKLEAGHSCRAGTSAALLARDGATGAPRFLEDLHLAFAVVRPDGSPDVDAVVRDLGTERSTIHQVEFKKYPGCGLLHASVDALADLLGGEGLTGEDVATVETAVSRHTAEYCDRPHPATLDSARWSFSFALAEVLLHGRVGLRSFADERALTDPAHRAARDKVRVVVDPTLSTGFSGAHVTVHLHDGRTLARDSTTFRGHPDDPLAPDEVVAVLSPFLDEAASPAVRRRLVELVMDLDRADGVGELMHLVTTFRHPSPRRRP